MFEMLTARTGMGGYGRYGMGIIIIIIIKQNL